MPLQHDYPVGPSELFGVMLDPVYLQARQDRFGGVGTPEVKRSDDSIEVTVIRQLPLDKVPGAFRGFVGDGRIVQVDTWHVPAGDVDDTKPLRADWRAKLGTAPARMGGHHEIVGSDAGARYTIDVDVSINVPFVGGKIESQVRGYLEKLISRELDFLAKWIDK